MTKKRKRALVLGVANDRSIATGVVEALLADGVEVAATCLPMMMEKAIKALPDKVAIYECSFGGTDDDIIHLSKRIQKKWKTGFDYLVHAIAFSDRKELQGSIFNTTRPNFLLTLDISALSFYEACKHFGPQMREGGGAVALTFAASRYRSPQYNTMAPAKAALETLVKYIAFDPMFGPKRIKVIAVSAGPIRTLSSAGVKGFTTSLKMGAMRSATGTNVSAEEVGQAIALLLKVPGLTGGVIDIDNGIVHAGMGAGDAEYAFHANGPEAVTA